MTGSRKLPPNPRRKPTEILPSAARKGGRETEIRTVSPPASCFLLPRKQSSRANWVPTDGFRATPPPPLQDRPAVSTRLITTNKNKTLVFRVACLRCESVKKNKEMCIVRVRIMVTFREERSKDDLGGDQSGTVLGFFISYVFFLCFGSCVSLHVCLNH